MISIKKLLFTGSFLMLSIGLAKSQTSYFEDALRFSKFNSTGSARISGLGGTQMSLGGDISNIHANAAGLGFFRRSEFSLTPSFGVRQSQTNFSGQIQNDRTPNFSLPNLSLVLSSPKGPLETGSFRGGTFGISFNRIADFNNQFGHFSTQRNQSSLLDFYISQYNAFGEPPLGATDGLVLDIELVQGNETDGFFRDPLYAIGQPLSDEIIITEGGISQTSISYGANFDNKLFIGAGLGLQSVNFFQNRIFGEEFRDSEGVRSLIYSIEDNTRINGFGANINLGIIYKPIETVNLGVNFKSPTWHRLNKEVDANIIGEFFDLDGQLEFTERELSNVELSTANLSTPLLLSAGGTFFFNKNGFITADIDYIDYSQNRINSRDFDSTLENNDISTLLGNTFNYRIGGEYRFDIWRLRAGYAYYGDPTRDQRFDRSLKQISGGLGVKMNKLYVDFALINSISENPYFSYSLFNASGNNIGPLSIIRKNMTQGLLTIGFNF